jgi:hypothetical protein
MENHRPIDKFALGFYNGVMFGSIYSFSRFHKDLPEGNLNFLEKSKYFLRHVLFFSFLYGGYLCFEQFFLINQHKIKKSFHLDENKYKLISSIGCSIGSLALGVPFYLFKNRNCDLSKNTVVMFGLVLASINYFKQENSN